MAKSRAADNKSDVPTVAPVPGMVITRSMEDVPEDSILFYVPGREVLRFDASGDIYVKGKLTTNDKVAVDSFREWLAQAHKEGYVLRSRIARWKRLAKKLYAQVRAFEYRAGDPPRRLSAEELAEFKTTARAFKGA